MNHDVTHCADYKKSVCPKTCSIAEVTEDLKSMSPPYPLPVSYAHYKGTKFCPICKKAGIK